MTAESSDNKEDGAKAVALTFSMQGIGYLSAPVIGWLQVSLFPNNPELIWRLLLGAGCIPGGWLMALRVRRQFNRVKSLEGTAAGKAQIHVNTREVPVSIMDAIKLEENLVQKMLGTGGCWLLFDILFYGNTLFQPVVLAAAFGNSETIQNAARDTSLISAMALPGYFFSVVAVGHQSPRFIQAQGFLMMGILYTFIGFFFRELTSEKTLLLILYGSTFFFSNYGPNSTVRNPWLAIGTLQSLEQLTFVAFSRLICFRP